ncbi:MAG: hypothetical protein VB959_05890, partial [Rhodospirillales bacterium]
MRLKGMGDNDDLIAAACTKVYEDEFGHGLSGIIGLDKEGWSGGQFARRRALFRRLGLARLFRRNQTIQHLARFDDGFVVGKENRFGVRHGAHHFVLLGDDPL